jgi:hypothetical protein
MTDELDDLVDRARLAAPNDRIELRDAIAGHGSAAVDAMGEWLANPVLTRFAVRVIGRAADLGDRNVAVEALRLAREEATPDQGADIDAELRRLGVPAARARPSRSGRRPWSPADATVPGWMMRTNRDIAAWIWSEVETGRLRQGWGYEPKQELTLLRDRRERGEPFDTDDENAWPNRRMLADEPDGMQAGDLVLLPHLPREWRWSVARITGPYRYEIHVERNDYGHILPVEVVEADLGDDDLTQELRGMRTYPARLRRLSRQAYGDLQGMVGSLNAH